MNKSTRKNKNMLRTGNEVIDYLLLSLVSKEGIDLSHVCMSDCYYDNDDNQFYFDDLCTVNACLSKMYGVRLHPGVSNRYGYFVGAIEYAKVGTGYESYIQYILPTEKGVTKSRLKKFLNNPKKYGVKVMSEEHKKEYFAFRKLELINPSKARQLDKEKQFNMHGRRHGHYVDGTKRTPRSGRRKRKVVENE